MASVCSPCSMATRMHKLKPADVTFHCSLGLVKHFVSLFKKKKSELIIVKSSMHTQDLV